MPTTVTTTVKASGGDYTSLAAWEAAQQADLTALDQIREAACYNFADSAGPVEIAGWTTDATRYARIYAVDNHGGLYGGAGGTSSYRLLGGGALDSLLVNQSYTHVEGVSVAMTHDDNNLSGVRVDPAAVAYVERCIVKYTPVAPTYGNYNLGIAGGSDRTASLYISNCLILWRLGATRTDTAAVWSSKHVSGNTFISNCTIIGDGFNTGIRDGYSDTIAKNCLAYQAAFLNAFNAASTNCASSDTSATMAASRISQTFTFVNAGADDFHLTAADAGAHTFGADLHADTYPFSVDIDSNTRLAPWDIGADQIPTSIAMLTGTITSAGEADIVAGGKTIILTLTGDTWIPA